MILVTGATGFVGSNLIAQLLKDGHTVRAFVRNPGRAANRALRGCEVVAGDITVPASLLEALFPPVTAVIHLVGILAETDGATFNKIHIDGLRNVVNACIAKDVRRFIHISALGTRPDGRSNYHKTKWAAEEILRASGLEYTIFRPSVIFGAEDRFTNLFAHIIKTTPVVIIPGGGQNRMQPVFVKDVVRAVSLSIEGGWTKGKTYEIGGKDVFTFDEVIDLIAAAVGRRRLKAHFPMPLMRVIAALVERLLPKPPITRDQLLMLEEDNVTVDNALTRDFGITPVPFAEGMTTYLR